MTENKSAGKLLSNAPCKKDLFEGAPHQKLAQTIADELQSKHGCSIIGIDGEWGSGKSNLLEIVKDLLQKGDKDGQTTGEKGNEKERFHFFTYDAWKHQTDLPRRTVLEELTKDLVDVHKILTGTVWQTRLKELLAKKKSTNTITVPSLGCGTIASVIAIISTPLLTHLAVFIDDPIWQIMVLIVPYLIIYIVATGFHLKKMKNKWKEKATLWKCISTFFLVYEDRIKEDTTYETISEEEASGDQFKKWFSDIDKELTKKNTILVLVFDNIDRLPKEKVRELWAAALTFFSEPNYSNIRMIVPFDRTHLRGVFQTENVNEREEAETKTFINYADDFINKTFSVVYCVPPPIMTGWMQYFKDRWKEALNEDAVADDDVLQIYDMLTKNHTPRKIIAFINQFVTIKRICDPEIENKYIALYILGRDAIVKNPLTEILKPSYLGSLDFVYGRDSKMSEVMSALHYQLPIKDAMDIVFVREISRELNEKKTTLIDSLKGNKKYWALLRAAIINVENFGNTTIALCDHFKEEKSANINSVWETLYKKVQVRGITDTKYEEYHRCLMKNISDKENYYKALLKQYHKHIADGEFDVKNYINGIDELRELRDNPKDAPVLSSKSIIKPSDYLILINERKENATRYELGVNDAEFDEHLYNLTDGDMARQSIYPHIKGHVKTPKYMDRIRKFFKNNNNLALDEDLIHRIKEVDDRPIKLREYWDDNKLQTIARAGKACEKLLPDAIAIVIATQNVPDNTNTGMAYRPHLDSIDEKTIKSVANVINDYMTYGELLLKLPKYKSHKLVVAVAKELITNSPEKLQMNVKQVLENYDAIVKELGMPQELLTKMCDFPKQIEKLDKQDVENFSVSLIKEMKKTDNDLTNRCLELVGNYLESVSQEDWEKILCATNKDKKFELFETYHPDKYKFQLCFDAFKGTMRNYAMGKSSEKIPEAKVSTMIEIYKDCQLDVSPIFEEIRDVFIREGSITKEQLKYYGDWLLKYGRLDDNPASLEKIFRSDLLDATTVKILVNNATPTKLMVDRATNPIDFRNKMSALRNAQYKNDEEFNNICDLIGISCNHI